MATSVLPEWYAESRYLHGAAIAALSDTAESLVFGQLFMTPSNHTFRDGNHLVVRFCHLEYPWDRPGSFADPPRALPQIIRGALGAGPHEGAAVPRCIVDATLVGDAAAAAVVGEFEQQGFACERAEDVVMAMTCGHGRITPPPPAGAEIRPVRPAEVAMLAACNASSFGYDRLGDVAWLAPKLGRQLDRPEQFRVHAAFVGGEIASFASVFCSHGLAFVQTVGTHPRHQRRGLARAVLGSALATLPAGTRVYLDAYEEGSMRMYRRVGFDEIGRITYTECLLKQ
ncbi:hypothetical protein IWQ56_001651 [Coemansia nantahalensis]|uniref:Uncharacterized protein n=2 Tax=Coemansia TaxID=4863 RepID=A0ACC1LDU8_9FUNG|nr:hypothetical protein IWQ57_002929 [Coemansia nantahalensis]KAJ2771774.1 hypothetical protein IWQ56_001651 [Coemansia nantahalensis]KAJ2806493.1 hypothetical protein H4R21_000848 [Coemansia helicoidea]